MVKIIAEAGVNHNGDRDMAFALVDAAADAGADAVKFQTFKAERLALSTAPKAHYQNQTTAKDESQLAMLKKLELPEAWHHDLQAHARKKNIEFISTAFDQESLLFLEKLELPYYKIPSGEITNGPLLLAFARTGKKLILSTGMATLGEVEQALAVLAYGFTYTAPPPSMQAVWQSWSHPDAMNLLKNKVILLHCTSQYPTPMEEVNLLAMDTLAQSFGLPVGYSDHTEGLLIPMAAVARGAVVIEKHFTLDRNLPGPDHKASLEPSELSEMVRQIRDLEKALGDGFKRPQASEWDTRRAARQTLIALEPIEKGEVFSEANLGTSRAGFGESAMKYWDTLSKKAYHNYRAGQLIQES